MNASNETETNASKSNPATTFNLIPFDPLPNAIALNLTGSANRTADRLTIDYHLTGDLNQIQLPKPNTSSPNTSCRKDRLWEQTCLEFFLTANQPKQNPKQAQAPYWEFNLSPTGDWNIFALESYRQGLKEEPTFTTLPFSIQQTETALNLNLSVDLSPLLAPQTQWALGISAVILLADGTETYWALTHPTPTPDFHSPGSFTLTLTR